MANMQSLNKVREAQYKLTTKQLKTKQPNGRAIGEQHVHDWVKRGALEVALCNLVAKIDFDRAIMKQNVRQVGAAKAMFMNGRLATRIGKDQARLAAYIKAGDKDHSDTQWQALDEARWAYQFIDEGFNEWLMFVEVYGEW
jgi:hypothetical protein